MDISALLYQIIYILSSYGVSLSISIIAIAVLIALQRKNKIKGFKFFIISFCLQIVLIVVGAILNIVPWLVDTSPSPEVWTAISVASINVHIFLMSLFYFFLSLGFLSLLGYKTRVNRLAIASAVLSTFSLFVPWFAMDTKLIAPTYVFPLSATIDNSVVSCLLPIIVSLLTIATYCFVVGSAFSGRIGWILILVGVLFAFVSPFTYFLVFSALSPWIGLVLPFVSTMIAYFALQYHPKELERAAPDLTGLAT